jgi:serine/threonine-protein kinase HipA
MVVSSWFYDLLSVATYDSVAFDKKGWPIQTLLAWPILGVRHFSDINRVLLLEAGASLNLAKGTAQRLLENLRRRAVQEAEALYAEVEAENAQIASARPELSATMAGESRCIRAILHTVLKDMDQQIA